MLIKYKFANGEVSEVDVSEDIGEVIVDSRKKEQASNRRKRYHCYSFDAASYLGLGFMDDSDNAEIEVEKKDEESIEKKKKAEEKEMFYRAFSKLTETQKRRLVLYGFGFSSREIARQEGVNHKSVLESIDAAKKKFEKIFANFL